MVVDSKEFKVNKTIKSNNVMDKFKGILEDKPVKNGIQLSRRQVKSLNQK